MSSLTLNGLPRLASLRGRDPLANVDMGELHIHTRPAPGQPEHERTDDCWCSPVITEPGILARGGTRVVDHSGLIAQSVQNSMDQAARGLDEFRSTSPIRTGRRLSSWTSD